MKQTLPIIVLLIALLPAMAPAQDPPTQEAPAPRARPESTARQAVGRVPVAPSPSERRTYSFQISLLLADIQGGPGSEGLSKNAQKALEDLKEFLPFKSYRLLDFAWLRTSAELLRVISITCGVTSGSSRLAPARSAASRGSSWGWSYRLRMMASALGPSASQRQEAARAAAGFSSR